MQSIIKIAAAHNKSYRNTLLKTDPGLPTILREAELLTVKPRVSSFSDYCSVSTQHALFNKIDDFVNISLNAMQYLNV